MPWIAADAKRHTKKAKTSVERKLWAQIATSELAKHGDDARAIRIANSVIAHIHKTRKLPRK
jgi:streptomycin 6-kinase